MAQSRHMKVYLQANVPTLCACTVVCNLIIKRAENAKI